MVAFLQRLFLYPCLLTALLLLPAQAQEVRALHGRVAQISYVQMGEHADLDRLFIRLKAQGYSAVILRLFHNEGDRYLSLGNRSPDRPPSGVYFPTTHAPVIEDVLTPALAPANRHGLQLYGWLGTRRADWLAPDHPLKDPRTNRISLFHQQSLPYLRALYADLARSGVHGILIQDDLIYRTEDELPTGIIVRNPSGYTREYHEVAQQRARVIAGTLAGIIEEVHHHHNDCRILLNIYYEHGTNPDHALLWLAQDLQLLAQLPVYRFSIMSYHRQIGDELGLSREGSIYQAALIVENIARIVGHHRILPKIQTEDFRTGEAISPAEVHALERLLPPGIPVAYMPVRRDP